MTSGIKTILYPVRDAARAKAAFAELTGVAPHADSAYYVGFRVGEQEIGLVPNGHAQGLTGVVPYWHVDDLDGSLARLLAAGAETVQPAREVGGGRRVASVRDVDGNLVGLLQDA